MAIWVADAFSKSVTFNYRILRRNVEVAICEVFYGEAGDPTSCTEEPVSPAALSGQDLKYELQWIMEAFDRPVVEYEEFLKKESE